MSAVDAEVIPHRRQLPLYALYAANLVSFVGDMMMFLAVPWFVLQTTGSVVRTGITGFFTTGSVVVADVADRIAVMYAGRIVEAADADDLYARPAHPYTKGLLGSIPRLDL